MSDIRRDPDVRIYKYEVAVEDRIEITMPEDSEILSVQVQSGVPCMWVKVNTKSPRALRAFYVVGTGHPLPVKAGAFVGTFQLEGGSLVFHVFCEGPKR